MTRLYVVDYYQAGSDLPSDCYPDFLGSLEEAKQIATQFAKELDWIAAWSVRSFDAAADSPDKEEIPRTELGVTP